MSKTLPKPWTRSTSRKRCPKCGRAGCLLSSPADPAAVVCCQVVSDRPIGTAGYLHELRPAPAWTAWRRNLARIAKGTSDA